MEETTRYHEFRTLWWRRLLDSIKQCTWYQTYSANGLTILVHIYCNPFLFRNQQIQLQLHVEHVECLDVSDNACDAGAKLELVVVSSQFQGKPPLARHRMVHAAISDLMEEDGIIHAMTIQAWTPEQYSAKK